MSYDLRMNSKKLPLILDQKQVAKSKIFCVEGVELEFSNGVEAYYERLVGSGRGAVLIIPMLDAQTFLLIREYSCGVGRYELGFPKGKIDAGETWLEAAPRECIEEIAYRPAKVELLDSVTMSASYMQDRTFIVLASDLLEDLSGGGDEPEPLEVVPWKIDNWQELLAQPDFTEGRSYAALFLALQKLGKIAVV